MNGIVILAIIVALLALVVFIYNSLVRSKVRTDEAWSDTLFLTSLVPSKATPSTKKPFLKM
jgi:nitrate reductase gamma subunit